MVVVVVAFFCLLLDPGSCPIKAAYLEFIAVGVKFWLLPYNSVLVMATPPFWPCSFFLCTSYVSCYAHAFCNGVDLSSNVSLSMDKVDDGQDVK